MVYSSSSLKIYENAISFVHFVGASKFDLVEHCDLCVLGPQYQVVGETVYSVQGCCDL